MIPRAPRPSDHFNGQSFFNPSGANGQPFYLVPRLLMTPHAPWPAQVPIRQQVPPPRCDADAVVTFIGHATLLIQTAAANILTDPVYSERASPVPFAGPTRARRPGVRFADLPHVDVVLLSHNHYDHCDLGTLAALARRDNPLVVTPIGNARLVASAGLSRIEELDWWEPSAQAPCRVLLTPAQHFSARSPFDRNRALWGGFVVDAGARRIFFAGDSGYGAHFPEIGRRCGSIDLALLPIGAYEPRWFMKDVHMNPEEAVQAHLDVSARASVAIHFGTFQLTPEGIDAPVKALEGAKRARGVPEAAFQALECGESVIV